MSKSATQMPRKPEPIEWTLDEVPLNRLRGWSRNPRSPRHGSSHKLQDSIRKFGLCQCILVEPDNTIIDGHQRLGVLYAMNEHGLNYTVRVMRASRPLTVQERLVLAAYLHEGTLGDWDRDTLGNLLTLPEVCIKDIQDAGIPADVLPRAPASGLLEGSENIEQVATAPAQTVTCPKCGYEFAG